MELVAYQQPHLLQNSTGAATQLFSNHQTCLPMTLSTIGNPCYQAVPIISDNEVHNVQPDPPAFFGYSIQATQLSRVSLAGIRRVLHSVLFNQKENANPVSFHLTANELLVKAIELIHPPNIGTNVAIGYEIIDFVYIDPFIPEILSIVCFEQIRTLRRTMLTYMLASYDAHSLQSAIYTLAGSRFSQVDPVNFPLYPEHMVHRKHRPLKNCSPVKGQANRWLRTIGPTTGLKNSLGRTVLQGNWRSSQGHKAPHNSSNNRRTRYYETEYRASSPSSSSSTRIHKRDRSLEYKQERVHKMNNRSMSMSPMLQEKNRVYRSRPKSRSISTNQNILTRSLSELSLNPTNKMPTVQPRFGGIYNRYVPKANIDPARPEPLANNLNRLMARPPSQHRRVTDNTKSSRSSDSAFEHMPQNTQWNSAPISAGRRVIHRHHSKRRSIKSSDEVLQEILDEVKTVKKHIHALKADRMYTSYRMSETEDDATAIKSQSSKKHKERRLRK